MPPLSGEAIQNILLAIKDLSDSRKKPYADLICSKASEKATEMTDGEFHEAIHFLSDLEVLKYDRTPIEKSQIIGVYYPGVNFDAACKQMYI